MLAAGRDAAVLCEAVLAKDSDGKGDPPFRLHDKALCATVPLRLPLLQEPENNIRVYTSEYLARGTVPPGLSRSPPEHAHYLALDTAVGPVCVTVCVLPGRAMLMVRTGAKTEHLWVLLAAVKRPRWYEALTGTRWPRVGDLLATLKHPLAAVRFRRRSGPAIAARLLRLDNRLVLSSHTIGVVYAGRGQSTLAQCLGNASEDVCEDFWVFLRFLADRIKLNGWPGFAGGLDVESGTTGKTSFFTRWQQLDFMFHVGPLLPTRPGDPQHIERNRFIGNDIVLVVFHHPEAPPFLPSTVTSHQTHIVVVVTPSPAPSAAGDGSLYFSAQIYCKKDVGQIVDFASDDGDGETLSTSNPRHRDLLLAKLLVCERASHQAPKFARLFARVHTALLQELVSDFI